MKKWKKVIASVLVLSMLGLATACGGSKGAASSGGEVHRPVWQWLFPD